MKVINLFFHCSHHIHLCSTEEQHQQQQQQEVEAANVEQHEISVGVSEEDFAAEAATTTTTTASTACGPSPDREIEEIFASEHPTDKSVFVPVREIPSRSSKVSIGTSPPPQSISTQVTNTGSAIMRLQHYAQHAAYLLVVVSHNSQTYDTSPFEVELEQQQKQQQQEQQQQPEGRFANRGLKRSQSFAAASTSSSRMIEPPLMYRSASRQSFSSEFQVSGFPF